VSTDSLEKTNALVRAAQTGDPVAIDRLLAQHRARLRRMVAVRLDRRLASRVDASDVVQETLITATRRLDEYLQSPTVPFYPWLRQIAWNTLVDLYRFHVETDKRSVENEQNEAFADASQAQLADQLVASGTAPSGRMLRTEMIQRVHDALALLTKDAREILELRHLEYLSSEQAAEVMGISHSAAKMRHLRALRRLREVLDSDGVES